MEASTAEHVLSDNTSQEPKPFLIHVQPAMMQQAWPVISPLLEKGCTESRGEFSLNRILTNLEHWPILAIVKGDEVQAVMVTCITQLETRRILDCLLACGDHAKDWAKVDEDFDEFARAFGCTSVRIPAARKGWAKALPHWRIVSYVMEREI